MHEYEQKMLRLAESNRLLQDSIAEKRIKTDLLQKQMTGVKRLIKQNRKQVEHEARLMRQLKKEDPLKIKLPFILAAIPDNSKNSLTILEVRNQLELISDMPIRKLADGDVLEIMGLCS